MILVTGGAGFVGSNLVFGLNQIGITDILIIDNLKNSIKHKNLNKLKFTDFIDKDDFINKINCFKNIDLIFHQGACSNTLETDGKYMMKNNYEYSKVIFNHCIKNNIRFIYASSASVYGNGKLGFNEDKNCEYPLNIYAFSKYLFDRYVKNYFEQIGLNNSYLINRNIIKNKIKKSKTQIVGLRYFNVYGPQENHKGKMSSTIYHFFHQIKNNNKMKLFTGSENYIRDFIYVEDVVNINIFFLNNTNLSGIFNCGTSKPESFLKVAQILNSFYKDVEIEFIPFPEELKGKYQTYTSADISKLRNIGYKSNFTSLEDGIKKYIKHLEENDGYL